MLSCVVNVSEGRDRRVIDAIAGAAGRCLLDVHSDPDHHRTVLSLAGDDVEVAVRDVATRAVELIDLREHRGVHPRLGAVDVVPFVPLDDDGSPRRGVGSGGEGDLSVALEARGRFGVWAGLSLELPCFFYGPERSLPTVRQKAFSELTPDSGPGRAHPSAGACAVGARFALIAYNLWLATAELDVATAIAGAVRGPAVRALGLATAGVSQVSCNLIEPWSVGPDAVYDAVEQLARVAGTSVKRAELVGLAPATVVKAIAPKRWGQLDIDPERTVEARLERWRQG